MHASGGASGIPPNFEMDDATAFCCYRGASVIWALPSC